MDFSTCPINRLKLSGGVNGNKIGISFNGETYMLKFPLYAKLNPLMSYAKVHAISLGEAFKKALFDRIEDEYDLVLAEEAYKDYVDSGYKSTAVADFWRELDEKNV
ncbi:type II toxin-antitoxin system RelB family antitoxin [Filifactor villosus]|uniref:Type II toxin-antitoxin system RelB family antitoxin n=1 Tax=Filifactor villosus TaxID=29374 RepID=A0ABV9QHH1_9FIRM